MPVLDGLENRQSGQDEDGEGWQQGGWVWRKLG